MQTSSHSVGDKIGVKLKAYKTAYCPPLKASLLALDTIWTQLITKFEKFYACKSHGLQRLPSSNRTVQR